MLHRVQATYRYDKEDPDELSFEIGETINVIEYDDPDDQVRIIQLLFLWISLIIMSTPSYCRRKAG